MVDALRKNKGMGLAAPQVGKNIKLLVAEFEPNKSVSKDSYFQKIPLTILVNPKIVKSGIDQEEMYEGCLSFPGLELPVCRFKKTTVIAQNIFGKKIQLKTSGLFARVLQHEIDHLDGILMTERTANLKMIPSNIRLCFLGDGEFVQPVKERLERVGYKLVGQDQNPDLILICNYGHILKKEELEKPALGCLNIHPSLLPKYRGPSPIRTALLNGDKETGVTVFKLDEQIDHGPLLSQIKTKIKLNDDFLTLSKRLSELAADLVVKTIPLYTSELVKPKEQNHIEATTTKKIKKEDAEIDVTKTPLQIYNQIRAFSGWPVAYLKFNGERFLIHEASFDKERQRIVLKTVQLEGKKKLNFEEFKRGYRKDLTLPNFML